MTRKIIKIGTSEGVTIPKDVRDELNLQAGDELEVDFDKKNKRFSFSLKNKKSSIENNDRRKRIAKLTLNFIDRYRKDLEALSDKKELNNWIGKFKKEYKDALGELSD